MVPYPQAILKFLCPSSLDYRARTDPRQVVNVYRTVFLNDELIFLYLEAAPLILQAAALRLSLSCGSCECHISNVTSAEN